MDKEYKDINLTDEEIIALHRKASDNKWVGVLLQRYTTLLLGVSIKYLKDKNEAADCVQAVFLKALTSLPEGEVKNFKGWLYVLTRNHCFQLLRDKKVDRETITDYDIPAEKPTDIAQLYAKEKELDVLEQAITLLDVEQRVCIKMFYLQKKSYQQIMEENSYTFKQVKSYIQNGKRNLKKIIIASHNIDNDK